MKESIKANSVIKPIGLVAALQPLAADNSYNLISEGQPPVVSAYVTRHKEVISQLVMPTLGLVVVIEGRKEVICGVQHRVYVAGQVLVLPAHTRVDVINEPDLRSGFYRALFVGFPRDLIIRAARIWPQLVGDNAGGLEPTLSTFLCSAIVHCAESLSRRATVSRSLRDHRALELLLILAEQGVIRLSPEYVGGSVAEAVRLHIRHQLHLVWTARGIAAALSMSEATLRRRLRSEAYTLSQLIRTERMNAAHVLLRSGDCDVADALAATGYRSRSHFSKHFRAYFGTTPASVRSLPHRIPNE